MNLAESPAFRLTRERIVAVARGTVRQRRWCTLQARTEAGAWETRAVILLADPEAVADAVSEWLVEDEATDWRIGSCTRDRLRSLREPTLLCHLAARKIPISTQRRANMMMVRDGMNPIVVTVGTSHTLREAARRMSRGNVGAAVVFDPDLPAPAIVTERDVLLCVGKDGDLDTELVGDHLTGRLVYAAAEWPMERAAEEMTEGGFRHVIVMEGSDVVGILSMRDIVRCWTGGRRDAVRSVAADMQS